MPSKFTETECKEKTRVWVKASSRKIKGDTEVINIEAFCRKAPKGYAKRLKEKLSRQAVHAIRDETECTSQGHAWVRVDKGRMAGAQYCRVIGKSKKSKKSKRSKKTKRSSRK
jgi:hypothetical protein